MVLYLDCRVGKVYICCAELESK